MDFSSYVGHVGIECNVPDDCFFKNIFIRQNKNNESTENGPNPPVENPC